MFPCVHPAVVAPVARQPATDRRADDVAAVVDARRPGPRSIAIAAYLGQPLGGGVRRAPAQRVAGAVRRPPSPTATPSSLIRRALARRPPSREARSRRRSRCRRRSHATCRARRSPHRPRRGGRSRRAAAASRSTGTRWGRRLASRWPGRHRWHRRRYPRRCHQVSGRAARRAARRPLGSRLGRRCTPQSAERALAEPVRTVEAQQPARASARTTLTDLLCRRSIFMLAPRVGSSLLSVSSRVVSSVAGEICQVPISRARRCLVRLPRAG